MSHQYYSPTTTRLQRSELAVPGSSPKMFEKAINSNADYIFLDLEDAVSPNDKQSARENIIKALNEINWREKGKTISVRINSLDTHYMYRDVVDIMEQVGNKIDTILVPKVGTSSDVYMVDCLLTQIENLKKLNIKINNTIKKINPTEKKVLQKMLGSPGKVFSRDDIGKIVNISKERTIDVMITRLRQKIESNPKNPKYLQTIRGSGYALWIE